MLEAFKERNLLKPRGKQRTDETHVLSANHLLNRLELIGETLHYALNQIATVESNWLKAWVSSIWFDQYGHSFNEYCLPREDSERETLAVTIGLDGMNLLNTIYNGTDMPKELKYLHAIEVLRQVWVQNYWIDDDDQVSWRALKDLRHVQSVCNLSTRQMPAMQLKELSLG